MGFGNDTYTSKLTENKPVASYEMVHTTSADDIICRQVSRTSDEQVLFNKIMIIAPTVWKGISEYDEWRANYCFTHKHKKLLESFRYGVIDTTTIQYALNLQVEESHGGSLLTNN